MRFGSRALALCAWTLSAPDAGCMERPIAAPALQEVPISSILEKLDFWGDGGAVRAGQDIAAGRLSLKTYGYPARGRWDYAQLLQDRLGIELRVVAGCTVTYALMDSVAAYNRTMIPEIKCRFGAGVLAALGEEAQRIAEARLQAGPPASEPPSGGSRRPR